MQDLSIIEENETKLTVYDKRYSATAGTFAGAICLVIGGAFLLFGLLALGVAALSRHFFEGIRATAWMPLVGLGLCLWGRSFLRDAASPDRVEATIWQFNRESRSLFVARRRRSSPAMPVCDEVVETYPLPPVGAAGWYEPNKASDTTEYSLVLQTSRGRLESSPHPVSLRVMTQMADRINGFLAG